MALPECPSLALPLAGVGRGEHGTEAWVSQSSWCGTIGQLHSLKLDMREALSC